MIVGTQAVQNVLVGRYKLISNQVRDYVYGLYGKPPAPIDPGVQEIVLKHYKRGKTPITCRAADVLEPEMENARRMVSEFTDDIGDVLIAALYPITGMRFLKWKHGLEAPPAELRLKTMEDIKREDELIARVKTGKIS